jgi:hypothetical protein
MRDFLGGWGKLQLVTMGYHSASLSSHEVPDYPIMYPNCFLRMSVNVPSDMIILAVTSSEAERVVPNIRASVVLASSLIQGG